MVCVEVVRLTSDVLATLHICICGHVAQRRASAEQNSKMLVDCHRCIADSFDGSQHSILTSRGLGMRLSVRAASLSVVLIRCTAISMP